MDAGSGNDTPPPKVDRFVEGYCAGKTVHEAADDAGIGRSTGYKLLKDPRVAAQIAELRAEIRRAVVDKIVSAQTTAIDQLVHHASAEDVEPTAASSVSAARALLAEARDWIEVEEFRLRVVALEQQLTAPPEERAARRAELFASLDGNGDPPPDQ